MYTRTIRLPLDKPCNDKNSARLDGKNSDCEENRDVTGCELQSNKEEHELLPSVEHEVLSTGEVSFSEGSHEVPSTNGAHELMSVEEAHELISAEVVNEPLFGERDNYLLLLKT